MGFLCASFIVTIAMRFRFIFLLFLLMSSSSSAQWKQLFKFPAGIRTIYFLDQIGHPETGYAGLDNGDVWKTTDEGGTWQKKFTDLYGLTVSDIVFRNSNTGWFCTSIKVGGPPRKLPPTRLYMTTDGGQSWAS